MRITERLRGTLNWPRSVRVALALALVAGAFVTIGATPSTASPVAPDAPTDLVVTPGPGRLSVAFTAPASDGGAAVTNYQYSFDNAVTFATPSPAHAVSPLVITGLTNGTSYQVVLRAVNSAGVSVNSAMVTAAPVAVGGPVILDGTDSGLHGTYSSGTLGSTWIYAAKAYENLLGAATGTSTGHIAVLGAADSTAAGNDCGAMAHYAAASLSSPPTVDYYDGAPAITGFFAALVATPTAMRPTVIHIVESSFCGNGQVAAETAVLLTHATALADFVNDGGGLYAQYQPYTWLSSLLPTVTFSGGGGSTPTLTAAGIAAFPGLSNADIAAPWHGKFSGDLGGLSILAQQSGTDIVIIGGASVTLPGSFSNTAPTSQASGTSATMTASARRSGVAVVGDTVSFLVTSGPNAGTSGTAITGGTGLATFSYSGIGGAGTDSITATWVDNGVTRTSTTTFVWSTPGATTTTTVAGQPGPVATTTTTVPGPTATPPSPTPPVATAPVPPTLGVGTGLGTGTGTGSAGATPTALYISSAGRGTPVALPTNAPPRLVQAAAAVNEHDAIAVTGNGRIFTTNPADDFGQLVVPHLNGSIVNIAPLFQINAPLGARSFAAAGPLAFCSLGAAAVNAPAWSVKGYWLVGSDGGVFNFGAARFFGSTGSRKLNRPVVAITPTPTQKGYWLVASDGGVFTFGDARFFGSTGSRTLKAPIVSLVPTASGKGYTLIGADGSVFAFGDARTYGSAAGRGHRIIGAAATLTGRGYWLVTDKRTLLPFGDAATS